MAEFKLDYVNSFYVRGKLKHLFRRNGHKRVTIPGRPGSPQFMDAYHALLDQTGGPLSGANIGESRTKAGTVDALIVRYMQHDSFTKGLAFATQQRQRQIFDNFRQCMTAGGRRYGANTLAGIQRKNIADAIAGKTPNAQATWLKTLRHLMAFAIDQGEIKVDPTIGIKPVRATRSDGHLTWGDEQIEQYRAHHRIGTMPRLALELMLNVAARRHDAHLLGRQHLHNGYLTWRPNKTKNSTGKQLTIRVMPELQAALNAVPFGSDSLTFLLSKHGRPFKSAASFGNAFAVWAIAAGLKPVLCDDGLIRSYRCHGLRKAACASLAHAGATGPEIMAVSGHSSLAQVQIYINGVDQGRMAEAAMIKRAAGSKRAQPE